MGYPIFAPQIRWGTQFWFDFCNQFGANLAPSWATLVQELVLDGMVGLREAQRISFSIEWHHQNKVLYGQNIKIYQKPSKTQVCSEKMRFWHVFDIWPVPEEIAFLSSEIQLSAKNRYQR